MKRLIESDIYIDIPEHLDGIKFDGTDHFLINQMQAVDFIIETENHLLYVEIKDLDNPEVDSGRKADFIERFKSEGLDKSLYTKYRDTWLYRYMNNESEKPVKYIVLIACESLSSADLIIRQDALKKKIPVLKNKGDKWSAFIDSCIVLNLESWNTLISQFPAGRISSQSS